MPRPSSRLIAAGAVVLALVATLVGFAIRSSSASVEPARIVLNDMRAGGGHFADGVLTVTLEAREGEWYPDGRHGPMRRVAAFSEAGRPMHNPGPLLRVESGAEVRVTVRNTLAMPLTMYGFGEQRGIMADSVEIAPGGAHEFRFVASEPGLYYYAGRTDPVPELLFRSQYDSQLNGAIVVDPAGTAAGRDRIFMISWWFTEDPSAVSGLAPGALMAINGAQWPHTERFRAAQGDSLHWRWINMTVAPHPMHLHGFYFRVDGTGDGAAFHHAAAEERRHAVTELLEPGGTLAIAWSPERPGNWIFHCHFAGHMSSHEALDQDRRHPLTRLAAGDDATAAHAAHLNGTVDAGTALSAHLNGATDVATPRSRFALRRTSSDAEHLQHAMGGLVLGITVKPRGRVREAARRDERALRLLLRSKPGVYGDYTGYAFVLGGSEQERDPAALPVPGPTLVLEKGQPVAVTLVNQSHEPAAVHWHGIELESFPDGVPGWSGQGRRLLPTVAPGDSLTVRFTPPRAGTFMYHSHFNEFQQIGSGMYGAIVVVEPGERYDPDTDRILLFSDNGPIVNVIEGPFPGTLLNGAASPPPIELRAGVQYRFRIINIGAETIVAVALLDGEQPVFWRPVAKDGMALPAAQTSAAPAQLVFASGEIYDVTYTPQRPGTLTLRYGPPFEFPGAPPNVNVQVRVQ